MPSTPHRALRGLLALCTAAGLASVAAPPAHAAPGTGPTAVVTMGDSYISGEAGRWLGNSLTNVQIIVRELHWLHARLLNAAGQELAVVPIGDCGVAKIEVATKRLR